MPGTTAVWDRIKAEIDKAAHSYIRVGVLASKGGAEQHPGEGDPITMVELAAIHEFGATITRDTDEGPVKIEIPERSYIRSTFLIRRVNALRTMQTNLAKAIVEKGMTVKKALGILGSWASAEVKNTITEIDIPPPLAQSTIDAKGSTKPLVDTGRLLNAITYEIVETAGTP